MFGTGVGNPYDRPFSSLGQGTFTAQWKTTAAGSGLYIHYSAIPEPGSMALCGLGALAAGWYGRRRLKTKIADDASTSPDETEPSIDARNPS